MRCATADGLNKFEIINLHWGGSLMGFLSSPYTLLGGLLGGTFLTMASHGTDQLLVQRLLGCRSKWDAQRALMLDATFIVLQFAFFLVLGLCLYRVLRRRDVRRARPATSDEIFPKFIVENLPTGLAGPRDRRRAGLGDGHAVLLHQLAGVVDVPRPLQDDCARGGRSPGRADLVWSKVLHAGLGRDPHRRRDAVHRHEEPGRGARPQDRLVHLRRPARHVLPRDCSSRTCGSATRIAGFVAGILAMVVVLTYTTIDFTWHTLIGCAVTLAVGNLSLMVSGGARARG